jgi:dUTP pyrophosphatase
MIVAAITRLPHGRDLPLPAYATAAAAGADLLAAIDGDARARAGRPHALVPTGIAVALPPDTEIQVRPRSGLALGTASRCSTPRARSTPTTAARSA